MVSVVKFYNLFWSGSHPLLLCWPASHICRAGARSILYAHIFMGWMPAGGVALSRAGLSRSRPSRRVRTALATMKRRRRHNQNLYSALLLLREPFQNVARKTMVSATTLAEPCPALPSTSDHTFAHFVDATGVTGCTACSDAPPLHSRACLHRRRRNTLAAAQSRPLTSSPPPPTHHHLPTPIPTHPRTRTRSRLPRCRPSAAWWGSRLSGGRRRCPCV